jgi:multidrug transporter EmrE-like cation transporter
MQALAAGVRLHFPVEGDNVNAMKMLGIALVVAGVLGLMYGGFSYTKESHETKIGPLVLSVTDKETVNVPIWVGVGAIVIGGLILVLGNRKS